MAKFRDIKTGFVSEIGSPDLNPNLLIGKEEVAETTALGGTPGFVREAREGITPEIPDVLDSDVLTSNITRQDIFGFLETQRGFQEEILGAVLPTEEVTALRTRATEISGRIRELGVQEVKGVLGVEAQERGKTLAAVSGQQRAITREVAIERLGLATELQATKDLLQTEVDAQQVRVDALTTAMEFNQTNFENLVTLSDISKPDVLGTQVDKVTGEITAIIQNPDGSVSTEVVGALTPEKAKAFTAQGHYTNKQGQVVAWGTDAEGNLVSHIVGEDVKREEEELLSVSEARDLGVPFGTTKGQAAALGITPTPAAPKITTPQRAAAGFAARIGTANEVIVELGKQFTGAVSRLAGAVPRGLQSEARQRFDQATRNFINATLRRESGAAIAPSEFDSAELQYIPQPGDTSAVLEQKTQNRQTIQIALELEGGEAFTQLEAAIPKETVVINGEEVVIGSILENQLGQRARVNQDGTVTVIVNF